MRELRMGSQAGLSVNETGTLEMVVYGAGSFQIWSANLLKLSGNEYTLNGGRFRAFRRETQPHEVAVSHSRLNPVNGWASDAIDWLVEHNAGALWSMRCVAKHVSDFSLVFSFADAVEGAHFALRWR